MEKQPSYDVRGKLRNLSRQIPFNKLSFVHLVFYRTLIITSIITFALFIYGFVNSQTNIYFKTFIIIDWILLTPQFYVSIKGLAMIGSNGIAFGHLNKSFLATRDQRKHYGYKTAPYLILIVWLIGAAALAVRWLI